MGTYIPVVTLPPPWPQIPERVGLRADQKRCEGCVEACDSFVVGVHFDVMRGEAGEHLDVFGIYT